MSKANVKIEVDIDKSSFNITGRCVGFLTEKEFNAALINNSLMQRLYTTETKNLWDLSEEDSIDDYRLAVVLKTVNDEEITGKKVFFTEKLDFINNIYSKGSSLYIVSKDGNYVIVEDI